MGKRIIAVMLAITCLVTSAVPCFGQGTQSVQPTAEAESTLSTEAAALSQPAEETDSAESAEAAAPEEKTKPAAPAVYPLCLRRESSTPEAICQEITDTYKLAQIKSEIYSFSGLCGAFVCWQTLLLGIDWEYKGGNGNELFDKYKDLPYSTGGYGITAYAAPDYTMRSAIEELTKDGPVFDLLVGFEHGSNTAEGKKYGHAMFVNAIIDDTVYFSESFRFFVNHKYYREGTPVTCSVDDFCKVYERSFTQFEGIIHFTAPDETFTTGTWENLRWALKDGTLRITGQGTMPETEERAPWHLMYRYIRGISIGEGITTVAANAFAGYDAVTEVSLPESLEVLGDGCFEGCGKLTELRLGSRVSAIAQGALAGCENLNSLEISENNPWYTVNDNLILSKDGTRIRGSLMRKDYAFAVPEGITSIAAGAFRGCSYHTIVIPETVSEIDARAFVGCSGLQELRLSGNNPVYTYSQWALIENGTLLRCMIGNRSWVGVPRGVTAIADFAFSACTEAQEIALTMDVEEIPMRAFAGCTKLLRVSIPKENKVFSFKDGILYTKDKTEALQAICVSGGKAVIAKDTEKIADNAFLYADSVTVAVIPDSVTDIGYHALGYGVKGRQENFTIRGGEDSAAREYAEENEISFEVMK